MAPRHASPDHEPEDEHQDDQQKSSEDEESANEALKVARNMRERVRPDDQRLIATWVDQK